MEISSGTSDTNIIATIITSFESPTYTKAASALDTSNRMEPRRSRSVRLRSRSSRKRNLMSIVLSACPPGGTIGHPGGQQKKFLPFGHGRDLVAFNGTGL